METYEKTKMIYKSLKSYAKALKEDGITHGLYIALFDTDGEHSSGAIYLDTTKGKKHEQLSKIAETIAEDTTLMRAIFTYLTEHGNVTVAELAKQMNYEVDGFFLDY